MNAKLILTAGMSVLGTWDGRSRTFELSESNKMAAGDLVQPEDKVKLVTKPNGQYQERQLAV